MLTCSKTFPSIPFAHRQWRHDGHCSMIHGHNWTLTLTFACEQTDANGFVIDFGSLGYVKDWLSEHLDHACVFAHDDPIKDALVAAAPEAWKVFVVESSASCEGLAMRIHQELDALIRAREKNRVWIHELELWEDEKNRVNYRA